MRTDQPPGSSAPLLDARFWLDRAPQPDQRFVAPGEINTFNQRVHASLGIPPVLDLPDMLDAALVRELIAAYRPPGEACFDGVGQPLGAAYWGHLAGAVRLPDAGQVPVRFGLAIRRTSVRAFPTRDIVTTRPGEILLDRLQETTIDLGWPVAAVAISADERWLFCLTPLYWGWVAAADIARTERDTAVAFARPARWATVTASRIAIGLPAGGAVQAQMGTRLPLLGQDTLGMRVLVPQPGADGSAVLVEGLISAGARDAVEGDLPCTPRTVLTQAFCTLGEPYAWGGSRGGMFGRDCSRLVMDAYAVTGVRLPRNTGQQAAVCRAVVTFDGDLAADERRALLAERVPVGAILTMPGHVMLYLGAPDGEPFVIHATQSSGYDGVVVSDLSLGAGTEAGRLLDRLASAVVVSG